MVNVVDSKTGLFVRSLLYFLEKELTKVEDAFYTWNLVLNGEYRVTFKVIEFTALSCRNYQG